MHSIRVSSQLHVQSRCSPSLRAQTVLRGVVAPCYQHHQPHVVGGVEDKVPQLHAMQSEPLD